MPREASINYEHVTAIADAIKAAGGKPNARQIRERHGSASFGTIHKLLLQWEAGQSRPIETALALPPALQRAILEFMDQELSSARTELEIKLMDAQQAANDLAVENERQCGQIDLLEKTLEDQGEERAALAGRVAQLETDLAAARDEAGRERQAAEFARTELAKAQLRLESMPILENENRRLLGALDAERTARTDAERLTASSEAKAAGLADRLADTQEHQQQTAAELAKSNGDRQRLAAELSDVQKEARVVSAQVGQIQGTANALERQVKEQAELLKALQASPVEPQPGT